MLLCAASTAAITSRAPLAHLPAVVVAQGKAGPEVWRGATSRIADALASPSNAPRPSNELDECTILYLLHAAMLSSTSTSSVDGSTRASLEEVAALLQQPLGRKGWARVATAYQEYVPLHPALEGPYMALLYAARAVRDHADELGVSQGVAAAATDALAGGGGGAGGGSAASSASARGLARLKVRTQGSASPLLVLLLCMQLQR